jgi:methyltransferase
MLLALAIIAFVALERMIEVLISLRNTRALVARGAVEHGASHYPVIVALHVAWFAALIAFLPRPVEIRWGWIAAFAALQIARVWTMASLGRWFSTRIVTIAGAPLVARGPYRFMRHPNYAIVAGEIAVLPLAFGEWEVALVFSILNAAMLAWRIRIEDRALAPRRGAAA